MGYVETGTRFTTFVDDGIVFALFILVFFPLPQPCSLLKDDIEQVSATRIQVLAVHLSV
jgi:hypothetical protein